MRSFASQRGRRYRAAADDDGQSTQSPCSTANASRAPWRSQRFTTPAGAPPPNRPRTARSCAKAGPLCGRRRQRCRAGARGGGEQAPRGAGGAASRGRGEQGPSAIVSRIVGGRPTAAVRVWACSRPCGVLVQQSSAGRDRSVGAPGASGAVSLGVRACAPGGDNAPESIGILKGSAGWPVGWLGVRALRRLVLSQPDTAACHRKT